MIKYVTALVFSIGICIFGVGIAFIIGSGEIAEDNARKELRRSTSFWVNLNTGTGPLTYKTREPITLPDGSQVVCVTTLKDLWCRDAK